MSEFEEASRAPSAAAPRRERVELRSGALDLRIDRAELALDELCGFASRRSRKRGFVFVSKVLGKHWPVRPSRFLQACDRLAAKLVHLDGPTVLISLAETATGLGQGVFEAWIARSGRCDLLLMHTTRYRLNAPLALEFEEAHSHATRLLLHAPTEPDDARLFAHAKNLVIVDDEISTGRTLANLATAYRRLNRQVESVALVSLTDWAGESRRAEIAERIGVATEFHNLLEGEFTFEPHPAFNPGAIPNVVGGGGRKDAVLRGNFGRLGIRTPLTGMPALADSIKAGSGEKLLVLGTGEFNYPPLALAAELERRGCDVHFQATTRSPLLVGEQIASALEFTDNYRDGIPNFVYNVADRRYDRVIVCYETHPLPKAHDLLNILQAQAVFF